MTESTKATKSVGEHIRQIYKKLTDLETRIASAEGKIEAIPAGSNGQPNLDNEIIAQVIELETRLKHLESENRELTELCSRLQAQNEEISNLYVAKNRLHASLEAAEIMAVIRDILGELVGASEFAIFLVDPKRKALRRVTGVGVRNKPDTVALGEGYVGKIAAKGKPYYYEQNDTPRPDGVPLAALPLKGEAGLIGIIVIWGVLSHKTGFSPIDLQLLELVAEHAPIALMSAHLHQKSKAQR